MEKTYIQRLREKVGNFPILIPGARIVVLNEKNEVLLQERADFKLWGIPAGGAELGESISETIIRELFEETGLLVKNPKPYGFHSSPKYQRFKYPNGDEVHSFSMMFYTNEYSGSLIKSNDETQSLAWHSIEANSMPPMIPQHQLAIEAFIKFRQTNEFQLI